MTDTISGVSSRRRETIDDDCDETTGVCGAKRDPVVVSHPGDVEEFYPETKIDPKRTSEIARNMSAAQEPKLDELSWTALRKRIADLEASKSDPEKLAECKRELERRQGIAAEAQTNEDGWRVGPSASGEAKHGVASGSASLVANRSQTVQIANVGGAIGANNEASVAAARVTAHPSANGTTTVEVGSARASAGVVNGDGSVGFHVAAQANIVAVEHTQRSNEGGRATGGLSAGIGFELSFGFKDDGVCMRVGAGPFTLGGCTTKPGEPETWTEKK